MAQSTELDELKQAMKELEEENASIKHENASLKKENASMKDTIQALSSAVLKNGQQRQPEREVKATLMETKYTNPKFVTDEEKKAIKFEMWTDDMHNTKFNDLIPSRMRHFRRKYSETSVKPFFFQDIDGRFRTPTAGDYRFDVGGCSGSRDDNKKHKVDWYLCHVPKQFDVAKNIVDNDSGGYEGETEECLLKMSILNENKRRLFLFSTDDENDTQERSVSIECDRDIVFWIEAVVAEGACHSSVETHFSGFLVR